MRLYCCTPRDCTCTSFVDFPRHAPSGLMGLMSLMERLVAACVCMCVYVCVRFELKGKPVSVYVSNEAHAWYHTIHF